MFDDFILKDCDDELFKKRKGLINSNKIILDELKDAFNNNTLDSYVSDFGYEKVYEILEILSFFEDNLIIQRLGMTLTTFAHKNEDEAFLNMYLSYSKGKFDEWLSSCNNSDLLKVKKVLLTFCKEDEEFLLLFEQIDKKINNI